ncbi:SDH family Clp fold serine proteinase [Henriciella aquimarina]|uniref:SDH family Clp fold serine proteinase n=1 Tax=Henriciella aquimarina TaxID=545261 RepID=UPI000A05D52F|nr:ATP-dependent Clp protease proteolytic subunit [Henriciella aquimarina]
MGELIWIVFLVFALQPVLSTRMLEWSRRGKISQIEKTRQSRVIALIHRQETMRLLGFPVMRYIDMQDSEAVLRAIQMTGNNVPIDLILHTPGGLVLASTQIARAIRAHPAKVTVYVPHMAMSGGTLIALAADEIVMSPHSVLGPVDPQINQYPAVSILDVVARKPVAEIDDETLIQADVARKAIDQLRAAVEALLSPEVAPDKRTALVEALSSGQWTHDYPISAEEAAALGLNISLDMPESVLTLMTMYPQPTRMGQSVEYAPEPRTRPPAQTRR